MAVGSMSSDKESAKSDSPPPPSASPVPSESASEPGKMFIGGLSWQTEKDKLQEYFEKFGELSECIVMKDPVTKRSRGFGFVTFKDPSNVEKVLKGGPHVLAEKTIDPKIAVPRKQLVTRTKKIFVGGLSATTTEDDVRAFFGTFGKVTECMLMIDKQTQRHRGFGFVTFDNEDIVETICRTHFHEINNKMVETKKAQPRDVMFPSTTGRGRAHLRPFANYAPFYSTTNWLGYFPTGGQRGRGRGIRYPASFPPFPGYFPFSSNPTDHRVRGGNIFPYDSWTQAGMIRPMMTERPGLSLHDQYDYGGAYSSYMTNSSSSNTPRFPTPLSPTAPANQSHLPADGNSPMTGQSSGSIGPGSMTPVYMGAAVTTAYGLPGSTTSQMTNGLTPLGMPAPVTSPGFDGSTGYSLPTPPYVQNGHTYQ